MKSHIKSIIIIGGGASGIMAAITAKLSSPKTNVSILEQKDRIGKKILVTGNGRCNISNANTTYKNFHGNNYEFTKFALDEFSVQKTIEFFNSLGLVLKEEKFGKLYPYCGQASAVLDVLRNKLEELNIEIINDVRIIDIKYDTKNKLFTAISSNNEIYKSDKVIISAGGNSYPKLGSDGSGYFLLKKFNHTITKEITPALVPILIADKFTKSMEGIKFQGTATLYNENKIIAKEDGEILFTSYGLSGPPILQLSGFVNSGKNKLYIKLDFMPEYSFEKLVDVLKERRKLLANSNMEAFFTGLINKKCGIAIGKRASIEKMSMKVMDLTDIQIKKIATLIKNLELEVIGTKDFSVSQVTSGGVNCYEFNDETMQSKRVHGLFVTGELYNFYGDCGGYNLQWAWSSGYLAGLNAVTS